MNYWRITKYNPKNRDKNDFYQKKEWTSVSDIGNTFEDGELTLDDYLICEKAYIDAIILYMRGNNVESIKIEALEKGKYKKYTDFFEPETSKYFKSLKNNMLIPMERVTQVSRFALRELIWCKLVSERMFVHFGYDYYMYIGSEQPLENAINAIKESGLFVEAFTSPYNNTPPQILSASRPLDST